MVDDDDADGIIQLHLYPDMTGIPEEAGVNDQVLMSLIMHPYLELQQQFPVMCP